MLGRGSTTLNSAHGEHASTYRVRSYLAWVTWRLDSLEALMKLYESEKCMDVHDAVRNAMSL